MELRMITDYIFPFFLSPHTDKLLELLAMFFFYRESPMCYRFVRKIKF